MQPTPYVPDYNFTAFQASNPNAPLPAVKIDAEFAHVADTLGGVLGNLALIQRDDGQLTNDIVTIDAISDDVLEAMAAAIVVHSKGQDAAVPNFTFEITTLAPGAPGTVNVTGVYPDLVVHLGIPKGDPSIGGATLEDADYGDVLVSDGGSVMEVQKVGGQTPSVEGHTHVIADVDGLAAALGGITVDWVDVAGKPVSFPPAAHAHTIAEVGGLQEALDAKADAGAYATTAQLDAKANALTTVANRSTSQNVSDGTHNGVYNRMTGGTNRTITFGGGPSAGHCSFWVNRGTVNMTVSCAGGYYKNGAAKATANFTIPPNGELSAFHEGGGEWKFTTSF